MLYKKCRLCDELKEIGEFHKKKGTKDGVRNECKECVKGIQKKYKDAPGFKEKQAEYDKQRYSKEKVQILERKKEYYQENKETILEQKAEYRSKPENRQRNKNYIKKYKVENREKYYKYRNDNPHKIAWRSVLYSTLKRMDTKKSDHTIKLLGYSADDLKLHIENQFTEGMSWDNHGEWHIDHIKPIKAFFNEGVTDPKIINSLSNLQPLWAKDNLSKGAKYND
jgi:hypothetical protein